MYNKISDRADGSYIFRLWTFLKKRQDMQKYHIRPVELFWSRNKQVCNIHRIRKRSTILHHQTFRVFILDTALFYFKLLREKGDRNISKTSVSHNLTSKLSWGYWSFNLIFGKFKPTNKFDVRKENNSIHLLF